MASKHGKRDKAFFEKTGITQAQRTERYFLDKIKAGKIKVFLKEEGTNTGNALLMLTKI